MIGIQVELDGKGVGAAQIFNNGSTTHRAAVPGYVPIQLEQGQHTIVLSQMTGTTNSDQNDFYTAVIHY